MKRVSLLLVFALAAGCGGSIDSDNLGTLQQGFCAPGRRCLLGQQQQGRSLSGDIAAPGQYVLPDSVVLGGERISTVRAVKGHLVGTNSQNQTIPPDGWAGATMIAGSTGSSVQYRLLIKSVMPTSADPSDIWWQRIDPTGGLYFYDIKVQQGNTWVSFCNPDQYGEQHAIPLPLYYDANGTQHVLDNPYAPAAVGKPTTFAWACSSGVSAKAVKWGYFPWLRPDSSSPNQMLLVHWALTRAARADYCGDGVSHTYDNTLVRLWDNVTPNPIWTNPDAPPSGGITATGSGGVLRAGLTAADPPPTLYFEAGWSTVGAICLAKLRWNNLPANLCPPNQAPFADVDTAHICDTQAEAERYWDPFHPETNPRVFNQSAINAIPPTHPIRPIGPIGPISPVGSLVK